jgi:hypothetical protein
MPNGSKNHDQFCIQRVQNDEMRLIYDLQRRALEKKVTAPPRSREWNAQTMERWAFHAPGCRAASAQDADSGGAAQPWECIVEEGFQATLAGTSNGKVYGAGKSCYTSPKTHTLVS